MREKLGLKLLGVKAPILEEVNRSVKITDVNELRDDEEITQITIIDDYAIVEIGGYQFKVDNTLSIVDSLNKGVSVSYEKKSVEGNNANVKLTFSNPMAITKIELPDGTKVDITEKGSVNLDYQMEFGVQQVFKITLEDGSVKEVTTVIYRKTDIYNLADLEEFRDDVNKGDKYSNITVNLRNDILIQGSEENQWIPIGNYGENTELEFSGIFEGNSHTIEGIYINKPNSSSLGLFGKTNSGEIKNLKIRGSQITGQSKIGAICGNFNGGTIENCASEGNTIKSSKNQIGGIAGFNNKGTILKCYNTSYIENTNYEIGGIVGTNVGVVQECYNSGYIKSTYPTIGGVVGLNESSILDCYNKGKVQTIQTTIGGIAGHCRINSDNKESTITNCYNIGNVVTTNTWGRGGIAGNAERLKATNCYWLNTCGASYGNSGNSNNNTGSVPKTSQEMKALVATLGNAYTTDETGTINDGYPILKWQVDNTR